MTSPGRVAYELSFQICPIILTEGIALPGGMLPIITFTEPLAFVAGLLTGGRAPGLDDFFAQFVPLPGATFIDNAIGHYPFANQQTAANAIIAQPLRVSMKMICPARTRLGFATKLATMMALQRTLQQHNASGGTYVVATPSFFYTSCIMTGMRDTGHAGRQTQVEWQLDFEQPLLTESQANQAQSSLMQSITRQTAIDGQPGWSGFPPTVGQPSSLAAPATLPVASGPAGAGVQQ